MAILKKRKYNPSRITNKILAESDLIFTPVKRGENEIIEIRIVSKSLDKLTLDYDTIYILEINRSDIADLLICEKRLDTL